MLGVEMTRYAPDCAATVVSLEPESKGQGSALLALWLSPFLLKEGEPVPVSHSHYATSLEIARIFLDLGYSIDVIDYLNGGFIPQKRYDFFISFRTNFEKIGKRLNDDCIKVVQLDTAHWLFHNWASLSRGLRLQQRRGVTLKGMKTVDSNMAIEHADYAIIDGNSFAMDTYRYAQKPLFRIPVLTSVVYPWLQNRDFEVCRNSFLWLGSSGLVHKGLDLVLEAFAEMPNCHLYVCGPIHQEEDFQKAYDKELYQTVNIHTIGWVDISSPAFIEIMEKCVGLIFPSCSESQAGSVLTCMHGGLIPIISYESDVEVDDFGLLLKECSIDEIKNCVGMLSSLPAEKLQRMSRKTWEFARQHYTREMFSEQYRKIVGNILEKRKNENNN